MIELLEEKIKIFGFDGCVSAEEIVEYLNADSYEDDLFALRDIVKNEYLLLHEIVEVCCIKKRGVKISKYVILKNPGLVYECHLKAIDRELEYAKENGDFEWISKRAKDIKSYLEDPFLPENLRDEVKRLIEKWHP